MTRSLYHCEPFTLQGTLVSTRRKDSGRLKTISIQTSHGMQTLKCSKWCRVNPGQKLETGYDLQVSGLKTFKGEKIKLEIFTIRAALEELEASHQPQSLDLISERGPTTEPRIAVCRKSNCCRKGADLVWKELFQQLQDKGLGDRVQLTSVQCLGQCKAGPAIQLQPSGIHHTHMTPAAVASIMAQYQ